MSAEFGVDRNASIIADMAYAMDDPHPGGFPLSPALRLSRALYAYEWAKAAQTEVDGWIRLADDAEVRAVVLAMEEFES